METRLLKYFLAVAREQSFSKAADSLFLSQPTLSRQLKDLEDELGKQLLIRGSKKITLTEEGMILRKRAEEIVELIEKAEQEVRLSDEDISGTIYIGAGETHAISLIARTANKLNETYPNIRYNFYSADGVDVSERLDKGLIDFGLLFEPTDISSYDSIPIPIHDTWGVLMRRDSPLAEKEYLEASDLWDIPLITSRQQDDGSMLSKALGKPDGMLNIAAQYNLVYNASVMVSEGMGYALAFDKLINVSGDSNLCFKPLYPKVEAVCHFVWKKYPVFTKAAQKFLDQFRKDMQEYDP